MRPKQKGSSDCGATPSKANQIQHRNSADIERDCKEGVLIGCNPHEIADGVCLRCVGNVLRRIGDHP